MRPTLRRLPQLWQDFQACRRHGNDPVWIEDCGDFVRLPDSLIANRYGRSAARLPRWLLLLANATAHRPPSRR